jgi:hypothetical protein
LKKWAHGGVIDIESMPEKMQQAIAVRRAFKIEVKSFSGDGQAELADICRHGDGRKRLARKRMNKYRQLYFFRAEQRANNRLADVGCDAVNDDSDGDAAECAESVGVCSNADYSAANGAATSSSRRADDDAAPATHSAATRQHAPASSRKHATGRTDDGIHPS